MKFRDYIKGDRRGKEAHRIELEAMRDPLLNDAIEGFDRTPGDHDAALERLSARIGERMAPAKGAQSPVNHHQRRIRNWSMTAAAAVLIGLTTGSLLILLKDSELQPDVAADTRVTEETPLDADILQLAVVPDASKDEVAKQRVAEPVREQRQQQDEKIEVANDYINVVKDEAPVMEFEESSFSFDDLAEYEMPSIAKMQVSEISEEPPLPDPQEVAALADLAKQLSGSIAGVMAKEAKSRSARSAVRGRVVEAGTGEPIMGATVQVKGADSGAVTDTDGYFLLSDAELNAKLLASFIGYKPAIVSADTSSVMLIAMNPDSQALEDVVVIGYGTQKKRIYVGSVNTTATYVPADTTTTLPFRRYLADELAKLAADNGPEGSATLEFEVSKQGRPTRITAVESSSSEALREARRILRDGPDWEPSEGKRRITIIF